MLANSDLEILRQAAEAAALLAGTYIDQAAEKDIEYSKKTTGDTLAAQVVTVVDVKSQGIVLEALEPLTRKYDLAVLAEEIPDDSGRLRKDYFWCIDPLDGTLAFIEGVEGYSVSIGLVSREGRSVLGVIYDVCRKVMYSAVEGGGLTRNGKPWNPLNRLRKPPVSFSWIYNKSLKSHPLNILFERELSQAITVPEFKGIKKVNLWGAALNACWVLEKEPACYFVLPKKKAGGGCFWDYAASSCIIREAGGWVSDVYGNPLDLNREGSLFMSATGVLFASRESFARSVMRIFKDSGWEP